MKRIEKVEAKYPMLNNCSIWINASEPYIKSHISEERFNFVTHHKFNDNYLNEKNLMPGTFILELLIESAKYAVCEIYKPEEDIFLNGISDYVIERALIVNKGKPMDLDIIPEITWVNPEVYSVKIKILSNRVNAKGKILGRRVIATSIVNLSNKALKEEYFSGVKNNFLYYDFSNKPTDYYDYFHSSHGPLFQTITGRFAVSEDRNMLIGEYDCKSMTSGFIVSQQSSFISEPLGNDTTLQYAVMLAIMEGLHGRLPIGGEKIQIFDKHPLAGKCYVFVEKIYMDEIIMNCNIISYDDRGRILMKGENIKLQKVPNRSYDKKNMDSLLRKYSCGKLIELHPEERVYV